MFRARNFAGILVFAVPVILYAHTLSYKFTGFDDHLIINRNIDFLSEPANIPKAFGLDAFGKESGAFYRPLQLITYISDIQINRDNYFRSLHLTNVLLFALSSLLLYCFLIRLSLQWQNAATGTIFFSVHPVFVSVSAWIPSRGDLLLAVFSLLSLIFLIEYLKNSRNYFLFLHWLSLVLALFSKETAVVLPVIFILYCWLVLPRNPAKMKRVLALAGYGATILLWLWIRSLALHDHGSGKIVYGETGIGAVLFNIRTIPESISRFFIPFDLDPVPSFSLFKTLTGILLIAILMLLAKASTNRPKKEIIFAFAWFLLFMAPALIFRNADSDYLDHRFFLPLQGVLILVLFLLPPITSHNSKYFLVSAIAVILVMFALSFRASRAYANPEKFYNTVIAENNRSIIGYVNRGAGYLEQGLTEMAILDYTKAIALKPDYGDLYRIRGNAYLRRKEFEQAIGDFTKAVDLKAADAETYNNRGVCYLAKGLPTIACIDFQKAFELGSPSADENLRRFCK